MHIISTTFENNPDNSINNSIQNFGNFYDVSIENSVFYSLTVTTNDFNIHLLIGNGGSLLPYWLEFECFLLYYVWLFSICVLQQIHLVVFISMLN